MPWGDPRCHNDHCRLVRSEHEHGAICPGFRTRFRRYPRSARGSSSFSGAEVKAAEALFAALDRGGDTDVILRRSWKEVAAIRSKFARMRVRIKKIKKDQASDTYMTRREAVR